MTRLFELMYVVPATETEIEEHGDEMIDGKLVDYSEYQNLRRTRALSKIPDIAIAEWPTGDREDEPVVHLILRPTQRDGAKNIVSALNRSDTKE